MIESIDGPDSAVSGSTITINDSVKNQGNTPIPTAFYVNYYLSSDTTINSSDTYLGQRTISGLEAGNSNAGASTFSIPAAVTTGSYYVGAIADATNLITESNESNNTGYDTEGIAVTAPYVDMIVTSLDGPEEGATSGSIVINYSVNNQGNTSTGTTCYVKYYLSSDTSITSSDVYLGQRSIASGLAGGASSSGSATLTIPAATAGGSYYIGAIADATSRIAESDETNNTGYDATQITVTAPDLLVSSVDGPEAGSPGSSISITSTVQNPSTAKAGVFYTKYYLSADTTISSDDSYLGQRYVSAGLLGGAEITGSNTVTIPAAVGNGSYYIGAIADATNKVGESDESNNTGYDATPIVITEPIPMEILSEKSIGEAESEENATIQDNEDNENQESDSIPEATESYNTNDEGYGSDLSVKQISGPDSSIPGVVFEIAVILQNCGTNSIDKLNIDCYLSVDSDINSSDLLLGQIDPPTPSLAAGETVTIYCELSVPITTAPGSYYIGIITDSSGSTGEKEKTKNIACKEENFVVKPLEDIANQGNVLNEGFDNISGEAN